MPAVFWKDVTNKPAHRLYGSTVEDSVGMQHCVDVCKKVHGSAPTQSAIADAWAASGFSWLQLANLMFKYGPLVVSAINDLVAALKSSGGLTLATLQNLYTNYGQQLAAAVKEVLALWGLSLPT